MNTNQTIQNPYIVDDTVASNSVTTNPYIQNENIAGTPATTPTPTFDTNQFLIGLAIGAVGTYILTNENAQKKIFQTIAKGTQMMNAGMEEMKERYEDAQAELEANMHG